MGEAPRNIPNLNITSVDSSLLLSKSATRKSARQPVKKRRSSSWLLGSDASEFDTSASSLETVPSLDLEETVDDSDIFEALTQVAPEPPKRPPKPDPTPEPVPEIRHKRKVEVEPTSNKRAKRADTAGTKRSENTHVKRDHGQRIWYADEQNFVPPFCTDVLTLPDRFAKAFSKIAWGPSRIFFTPNKFLIWPTGSSCEHILTLLNIKTTVPNTIVWFPFSEDVCTKTLPKLFRICFTNDFSLVCLCPFYRGNKILESLLTDTRHGAIFLMNPVSFCTLPCVVLFINCPSGPIVPVQNTTEGIFDISEASSFTFHPRENFSLIENCPQKLDSEALAQTQAFVDASKQAELSRQGNNFQCETFPPVVLNDFVRKRFSFDPSSNGPHFYPCRALLELYPKNLTSRSKLPLSLSYKEYNRRCGDDSKITGHPLKAEDMFCQNCGKIGHLPEICWMRFRSSKELGLTSYKNIVLNKFLEHIPKASSLRPLKPGEDKLDFINQLDKELDNREAYFVSAWKIFATDHDISPDLVDPGFSQIRQGLAFWYAIACPLFILQWVAFGIPVFWFFSRPPPFEVKPTSTDGTWDDSSDITVQSVRKFLDLQFIVPVLRQFVHCCAPLFDRQSSGSWRCIHDLRLINRFIMKINFSLFTAFNFCNLAETGAVFIVTDFSKCWHQLKHLAKDMKYFVFRTVEGGQAKYWLPLGKTFGESDVPFQITELISYVTALFSLFTLCSFWIDDGIIQVGNVHVAGWKLLASRIRTFTAKVFCKLCLIVNDKCDFQPSIEKPWVGLWNSGRSTFLRADKLEAFGNTLANILKARKISLGQAMTLQGKINSFGLGLKHSHRLKILNSLLKSIIQILDERPKSSALPISQNFGTWVVSLLNILLLSLSSPTRQENIANLQQIKIACDASNIGGGLVIEKGTETIFESSSALPLSHVLNSNFTQLEASSTDNERFVFEELALHVSKRFLDKVYPNETIFLKIFTDSLPLAVQLNTFRLKSLRASLESNKIVKFLSDWNMPFEIHYHPRTEPLAGKADANTRYFIPTFTQKSFLKFSKLSRNCSFRHMNISETLLEPASYFSADTCEIIPQNLTTSLYAHLFKIIATHCKCPYLFCPKLSFTNSVLFPKYSILYVFSSDCFQSVSHAFSILPFVLFECSDHRLTRESSVVTLKNQEQHRDALQDEMRRDAKQKELEGILDTNEPYRFTSWREFNSRPVTYEVEDSK